VTGHQVEGEMDRWLSAVALLDSAIVGQELINAALAWAQSLDGPSDFPPSPTREANSRLLLLELSKDDANQRRTRMLLQAPSREFAGALDDLETDQLSRQMSEFFDQDGDG